MNTDFEFASQTLIEAARETATRGLNGWTSGNLSVRYANDILITPSGLPFDQMEAVDLIRMSMDGEVLAGTRKPSSEWPVHLAVYRGRRDVSALVHTHSLNATAFSCLRQAVPSFHYMVAALGGKAIPCAAYHTPGTAALGEAVLASLGRLNGCLMANHGVIAVGANTQEALERADLIETLVAQYMLAKKMGEVVMLDDEQMNAMLEAFKSYGKQ